MTAEVFADQERFWEITVPRKVIVWTLPMQDQSHHRWSSANLMMVLLEWVGLQSVV